MDETLVSEPRPGDAHVQSESQKIYDGLDDKSREMHAELEELEKKATQDSTETNEKSDDSDSVVTPILSAPETTGGSRSSGFFKEYTDESFSDKAEEPKEESKNEDLINTVGTAATSTGSPVSVRVVPTSATTTTAEDSSPSAPELKPEMEAEARPELVPGQKVKYTELDGDQNEYIVVGPSKDEGGGVILKYPHNERHFAVSEKSMNRIEADAAPPETEPRTTTEEPVETPTPPTPEEPEHDSPATPTEKEPENYDPTKPIRTAVVDDREVIDAEANDRAMHRWEQERQIEQDRIDRATGIRHALGKLAFVGKSVLRGATQQKERHIGQYRREFRAQVEAEFAALNTPQARAWRESYLLQAMGHSEDIDLIHEEGGETFASSLQEPGADATPEERERFTAVQTLNQDTADMIQMWIDSGGTNEGLDVLEQNWLGQAQSLGLVSERIDAQVNNIRQSAEAARDILAHNEGLRAVDLAFETIGTETRAGQRSEMALSRMDKILDRIADQPPTSLYGRAAMVAATVGVIAATRAGKTLTSKAAVVTATTAVGVVGLTAAAPLMVGAAGVMAGFAYFRSRFSSRQERVAHARDRAVSEQEPGEHEPPRRAAMESLIAPQVEFSARSATGEVARTAEGMPIGIVEQFEQYSGVSIDRAISEKGIDVNELGSEDLTMLLNWVATTAHRVDEGASRRQDLIRHTSRESITTEQLKLDMALSITKNSLRDYLQENPEIAASMGAEVGAPNALDSILSQRVELTRSIDAEITQSDVEADRIFRQRALRTAVVTFGAGVIGGAISREVVGEITGHNAGFFGNKVDVRTGPSHDEIAAALPSKKFSIGDHGGSLKLPAGYALKDNNIIDVATKHTIATNAVDPTSQLPNMQTFASLEKAGIHMRANLSHDILNPPVGRTVGAHPYVADHLFSGQEPKVVVGQQQFLGNNTSVPNGNELRFYISDRPDGGVDLIFRPQGPSFSGNTIDHVEDPAVLAQVKFLWTEPGGKNGVLLNPDHFTNGAAVKSLPPGETSDFFRHPGPVSFRAPATGRLQSVLPAGNAADGSTNFHVLNTSYNNGPSSFSYVEQPPPTHVGIFEFGRDVPKGSEQSMYLLDPWVVPVSYERAPLEYIEEARPFPYRYGSERALSEAERERYRKEFSETILNNPDADLAVKPEVEDYFRRKGEEHTNYINSLAEQIDTPMANDVEAVVAIPVAGHQEGGSIYRTLRWYSGQKDEKGAPLDPSRYEVVLLVNKPEAEAWDSTSSEIERFKRDFPEFPLKVVYTEYGEGEASHGRAIRDVSDVVLSRVGARDSENDVVLISNDADLVGITPTYITSMSAGMSSGDADGVSGRLEWQPDVMEKSPLFGTNIRMMQLLDLIGRHPLPDSGDEPVVPTPGANIAYRASMYAAVGGYDPSLIIGADHMIREKINLAREGSPRVPFKFSGGETLLYTDARRAIKAFNHGQAAVRMWRTFDDPGDTTRVSEQVVDDPINYELLFADSTTAGHDAQQSMFTSRLEDLVDQSLSTYGYDDEVYFNAGLPIGGSDYPIIKRTLDALLRVPKDEDSSSYYVLEKREGNLHVRVTNPSKLLGFLERGYQGSMKDLRIFRGRTKVDEVFEHGAEDVFPGWNDAVGRRATT